MEAAMGFKRTVPWTLAVGRAVLGPVMIAGAACNWNGMAMAGMVVAALVSDIFDGVLARRWQSDTAALRLFDSMADTAFYVGAGAALWMARPQVLRAEKTALFALLAIEAFKFAFDFAKFGKPSSYHSYLAKCWGLVLATAVVAAFGTGHASWMGAALWLGFAVNVEGLVVSAMLPQWRRDVPTIAAAWRVRREIIHATPLIA
jgi:CDP-diacylglycerol--glycerol-3-phosphate 3-phosphatidyltransferase